MIRAESDPAAASPSAWLRMDWDDYRLALPQSDIARVGLPDELRPAAPEEDCAAWLPDGDGAVAVFRLDDAMRPRRHSGTAGYIVVCGGAAEPFALWCDNVRRIGPDQAPHAAQLPPVFARRRPPLEGVHRDADGAPLLTARAAQLGHWLFAQSARGRAGP